MTRNFIFTLALLILGIHLNASSQIQYKKLEITSDTAHCRISIEYPYCANPRATTLNTKLVEFVTNEYDHFRNESKEYLTKMDSQTIANEQFPEITIEVLSSYTWGSFISYALEENECPSWGCHGTTQYFVYNFDLLNQKFLSPKDFILTPNSKACRLLCSYLDSSDIDCNETLSANRLVCNINNYKISVDDNNIIFNFSAYELGIGSLSNRTKIPRKFIALKLPK